MKETKEYLNQALYLDRDIQSRIDELASLKAVLLSSPKLVEDKVQSSSNNSTDDTYIKIIQLEESINKQIDDLVSLKVEISTKIDSLSSRLHRVILREKYINMKTFDEIANQIPCALRQVHRYHGDALLEFRNLVTKCH